MLASCQRGLGASGAHLVSSPGVSQACVDPSPAYICGVSPRSFHPWGEGCWRYSDEEGYGLRGDPGTQTSTGTTSLPFPPPHMPFWLVVPGASC